MGRPRKVLFTVRVEPAACSGSYNVNYSHDAFGRLIKRASATNTLEYFYLNPTKGYQLNAYRSDAEDWWS